MTVTPKEKCPCGIVPGLNRHAKGTCSWWHIAVGRNGHIVAGPTRIDPQSAARAWDAMIRKWRERCAK
jgi:hypothetical protein